MVCFGGLGGQVAERINMPGGPVVGAMLFSGLAAVLLPGRFVIPGPVSTAIQIMLEISLGMTFDRSSLANCCCLLC